jgi:hypothetical protein
MPNLRYTANILTNPVHDAIVHILHSLWSSNGRATVLNQQLILNQGVNASLLDVVIHPVLLKLKKDKKIPLKYQPYSLIIYQISRAIVSGNQLLMGYAINNFAQRLSTTLSDSPNIFPVPINF